MNKKIFWSVIIISLIILLSSTHFLVFLYGKDAGIIQAYEEFATIKIIDETTK